MLCGFHQFGNLWQGLFHIAQHFNVHFYIFVDFGAVNIEMNDFCLFGIRIQIACYTVIETHADGDQYIAFVGFDVGSDVAMHTQHSAIEGMIGWHGRQTKYG
ncbi:MAG: hypothetical protein BWZ06_01705 [Bacteroidetes bacterium ADurb.BinA261]|nr:MAG: hypothetical protein BWZ06_01705 [Bacteroidetes bacterium ADurb.BinA261]